MSLLTGLISYFKLDEASGSATDSHGSNTLSDGNAVGSGTGKINGARDFETGSAQYLYHASNTDFQTGDIDFTFSLWVKFETLPAGIFVVFLAKDVDTPAASRDYTLDCNLGNVRFYGAGGGGGFANAAFPNDLNWHFVVASYTASDNNCHCQIDDGSITSSASSVPDVSSAQFRIGARAYSGSEGYFDGLIDECGFWKRTLTAGERTSLYNGGAGLAYPFGAAVGGGPLIRGGELMKGSLIRGGRLVPA